MGMVEMVPYVNEEGKGFVYKAGAFLRKVAKDGTTYRYQQYDELVICPKLQTVWVDKAGNKVIVQVDVEVQMSAKGNEYTKIAFFVQNLMRQHHIPSPRHDASTTEDASLWGTYMDLNEASGYYMALALIKKYGKTPYNFIRKPWAKNPNVIFYEAAEAAPSEPDMPTDEAAL